MTSAAAIALFLSSKAVLQENLSLQSEPLFLAFMLGGLLTLAHSLDDGDRSALLWGALLVGFAMAARYAGVALLALLLIVLLIHPARLHRPWYVASALALAGAPLSG